ncbi:DNA recombination protein RmuC [candidate division WWE3 bacterium]|nr:DNA recombination protein RmuC [candidate division WWE3 bacterium]
MTPAQTTLIITIVILSGLGLLAYVVTQKLNSIKNDLKEDLKKDTVLTQWLAEMKKSMDRNTDTLQSQLNEQRKTLDTELKSQREAMNKQTKVMWERLENASKVIGNVQKHLGGLTELGKDMKDLNNILKSPKLRGGLGEQFLYEILETALPNDLFKTQYKFKNGATCDAVVFTDKGIIPIDSKFPMENFKAMITAEIEKERTSFKRKFIRDVKKRIDEISDKYILPEEGTTEQAIMYIPSENVFYDLIVHSPKVEEYARRKSVLMTSPNTLSFFVKTVLVAYQQHELAKHAQHIIKALAGIKVEASKFGSDLETLGRHITNSHKNMDKITSSFNELFGRIERVQTVEGVENLDTLNEAESIDKLTTKNTSDKLPSV